MLSRLLGNQYVQIETFSWLPAQDSVVANDLLTSVHFFCNTLVKGEVSGLRYDPVIAQSIILVRQGSCRLCCIPVYACNTLRKSRELCFRICEDHSTCSIMFYRQKWRFSQLLWCFLSSWQLLVSLYSLRLYNSSVTLCCIDMMGYSIRLQRFMFEAWFTERICRVREINDYSIDLFI